MDTPINPQVQIPTFLGIVGKVSLLMGSCLMISCSSSINPNSEVVVSVKDQKLGIYDQGKLVRKYTISTSKFGIGDQPGSYRTPLGKHEIIAKIGHGLPTGAVLKSRSWNGEVLKPNAPGRDPIVSRILWLRGMEKTNRNAMNRFIYIHGTTEENRLGHPASYGCIRMGMKDVVDVFNEVSIGAKVVVTKGKLPHGKSAAEVPAPEAELVVSPKENMAPASAEPQNEKTITSAKPEKSAHSATSNQVKSDAPQENPVAGAKSKKPHGKAEKITTGSRAQHHLSSHLG